MLVATLGPSKLTDEQDMPDIVFPGGGGGDDVEVSVEVDLSAPSQLVTVQGHDGIPPEHFEWHSNPTSTSPSSPEVQCPPAPG